jgi:hypothetical protein
VKVGWSTYLRANMTSTATTFVLECRISSALFHFGTSTCANSTLYASRLSVTARHFDANSKLTKTNHYHHVNTILLAMMHVLVLYGVTILTLSHLGTEWSLPKEGNCQGGVLHTCPPSSMIRTSSRMHKRMHKLLCGNQSTNIPMIQPGTQVLGRILTGSQSGSQRGIHTVRITYTIRATLVNFGKRRCR